MFLNKEFAQWPHGVGSWERHNCYFKPVHVIEWVVHRCVEVFVQLFLLSLKLLVIFNVLKNVVKFFNSAENRGETPFCCSLLILFLRCLSFMEVTCTRCILIINKVYIWTIENAFLFLFYTAISMELRWKFDLSSDFRIFFRECSVS
jgi:hypothetical protein